jgi:hypothetical protein
LQWAIGRNGIYIEPDLEYIEIYKKDGAIINCAADGKCGYTSRQELAFAYFNLLTNDSLLGKTYNLFGEPKVLPIPRTTPGYFLIDFIHSFDDAFPCYITGNNSQSYSGY